LKAFEQLTVERGTSDLQLYPTHVLSFAESSSNEPIDGAFDGEGRNSPSLLFCIAHN